MPTLDIAIATLGTEGINRAAKMEMPRIDGVRYIISWQNEGDDHIPPALLRPDVEIHPLEGRGVSRNRNNALRHCTADIILNGDDDLSYSRSGLLSVIEKFSQNPGLDFATFRHTGPDNKQYPPAEADLATMPRNYSVATFELAIRRKVIDAGVRFDERFGPGASLASGEDEMMLLTLRRLGLRGRFFPIDIAAHPTLTTGFREITNPATARGMGAVIGLSYPLTGFPRVILKAVRMNRSGQMPLAKSLRPLLAGWAAQLFMKRPWKS